MFNFFFYLPKKGTQGGFIDLNFSWYFLKWSLFNSRASSSAFSNRAGICYDIKHSMYMTENMNVHIRL